MSAAFHDAYILRACCTSTVATIRVRQGRSLEVGVVTCQCSVALEEHEYRIDGEGAVHNLQC
jgi:hypothetical protein